MKTAIMRLNGATAQHTLMIGGLLCKLIIRRTGAPPNTTLTIRHDGIVLATLASNNDASTVLYPSVAMTGADGTAVDGTSAYVPVNKLDVSLSDGDTDTAIIVEAYYFA